MSLFPDDPAMCLDPAQHEAFRQRVLEDKAFARALFEEGMGLLRAGQLEDAQEKLELALMPNSAHGALPHGAASDIPGQAGLTTTTTTTFAAGAAEGPVVQG
jgi:hypothetical protein